MAQVVALRSAYSAGKRAGIRQWMKYFPLKSIDDVVELFEAQISDRGPELTCLSLVLGALELRLTSEEATFQPVNFSDIEFLTILRHNIPSSDIASCRHGAAVVSTREIVHKVSSIVWSHLSGSYHKDRAHIQSLYSLITGWLSFHVNIIILCWRFV